MKSIIKVNLNFLNRKLLKIYGFPNSNGINLHCLYPVFLPVKITRIPWIALFIFSYIMKPAAYFAKDLTR
jgi:hypothetical protein